jgi:uncharacterized protein
MYKRLLRPQLLAALADTPVVFLNGARQTGKSTLVRDLAENEHPARYLSFDDAAVLAAARHDPAGFVAALDGPVIIDEVQHAPDIFPALKLAVDRDRRPGRFLLTGSANILDPWQPKAQKWAISISNLEAKPKRSPDPQWQHIQNQGHVRMRSILN